MLKQLFTSSTIFLFTSIGVFGQTPTLVSNINTNAGTGCQPGEVVKAGNVVMFRANDQPSSAPDFELWRTNGSAAGTSKISINSGASGFPKNGKALGTTGDKFVFNAVGAGTGAELFIYTISTSTLSAVIDILPGATGSDPEGFTQIGATNDFVFAASDATGRRLFKSNLNSGGFTKISTALSNPANFASMGGFVYFAATDGQTGVELWRTDGTTNTLVRDINIGAANSNPENLTVVGNTLYFTADNGVDGIELWKSDGTNAGTSLVRNINSTAGQGSNPTQLTNVNGILAFVADNGNAGAELFYSDGTNAGTKFIDINPSTSSSPTGLTTVGNVVFFAATSGGIGNELFYFNPFTEATPTSYDINAGAGSSSPQYITSAYGDLYFSAIGANGREVHKWSNGSVSAVGDINAGAGDSNPLEFRVTTSDLVFFADDGASGAELYKIALSNAPTIAPVSAQSTDENQPLSFQVFINSAVSPSANLTLSASSSNTALVNTSGFSFSGTGTTRTVTITPISFANGTTNITLQVCDGANNCIPTSFQLTVNPVNNPPVASNLDQRSVNEDNMLTFAAVDFTSKFFDADGTPLDSIRIESLPNNGVLRVNNSVITNANLPRKVQLALLGTITYTPNTNFNGKDSILYNVFSGGEWGLTSAYIIPTINPVNDLPEITAVLRDTLMEDGSYTFNLTDFNSVYSDVESATLTNIRISFLPTNGRLVDGTDTLRAALMPRTISSANVGNLKYFPNANFNGNNYMLWRAGDGAGFSQPDTFYLYVTPVNDLPSSTNVTFNGTEDQMLSLTSTPFENAYSDIETPTLNRIRITTLPVNGTLLNNTTPVNIADEFTRVQIGNLRFKPDTNYFGTTSFEFRVGDGTGFSVNTAQANLIIAPVNDPPVVSTVTRNGTEDNNIAFTAANFSAQYSDVEGNNMAAIQITSLPSNGSLRFAGNNIGSSAMPRRVTVDSIPQLVYVPNPDFNGVDNFRWRGFDGNSYSVSSDTVFLNIAAVNDPPIVYNFSQITNEDTDFTVFLKDFTDNFTDVDGDTIVFLTFTSLPANGKILVSNIEQTNVPFNVSKPLLSTFTYRPNQNFAGSDTIYFTGNDGAVNSQNSAYIRFEVNQINDAPAVDKVNVSGNEDEFVSFLASDYTASYFDEEGDAMTGIKIISLPANGSLRINNTPVSANAQLTLTQINNSNFLPNANFNGVTYFRYQATDGSLYSNTDTVFININAVNDKPSITAPGFQLVTEDIDLPITGISVADVDAGAGQINLKMSVNHAALTLASTNNLTFNNGGDGIDDRAIDANGTLNDINAALASVTYNPDPNYNGFDNISIIISDLGNTGSGGTKGDTATIPIQIDGVNDTTIFNLPGTQTVNENENLLIQGVSLTNIDGDNFNVSVEISVNNGIVSLAGTALLTFTSGDGSQDATMRFFGPITAVNPALANLTYRSNVGFFGADAINFSVVDTAFNAVTTDNGIIPVNVNARPVTFINDPLNQTLCEGRNVTFSVTPEGTAPFSYQWKKDGNDITGATMSSLTLTSIDTSNIGSYTCFVTNAAGNGNLSGVGNLGLYDKPDVSFSWSEACSATPIQFTDNTVVTGGDTIQTYIWAMGDGTSFGVQNPIHSFSSSNPFNVSLIAETNRGCRDTSIQTVVVTPKPTALFSISDRCLGDTSVFTNNTSVAFGSLNYTWIFGDGDSSNLQNPSHLYNNIGAFNVSLIATNNGKCASTTSRTVNINPNPNANFNVPNICLGDAANFTNTTTISSGVNSYLWNLGDGNLSNNVSPSRTYALADTFVVKMVATSNFGCKDSVEKAITVYPKPNVAFTAASVCSIDTVNFSNASSVAFGGSSFMWKFGDGNTSTFQNPSHFYTAIGAYSPKLIVTGVFGCKDSLSRTVNVHPNPVAGFTYNNVCDGNSVDFANTSSIINGINSFNWTFGDGSISNNTTPSKLYATDGNYSVKLTVISDQLCVDSVRQTVRVFPQPMVNFSAPAVCTVDTLQINNMSTITNGGFTAYWNFGNGTRDTLNDFNDLQFKYNNPGTYNITLRARADSGCADTMIRQITINPMPQMNFTANDVCFGNSVFFLNSSSISLGAVTYNWDFNDGTTENNVSPTKNFAYADTFMVKLTGVSDKGCTDSIIKPLIVNPFPNVGFSASNECFGDSIPFNNNTTISRGGYSALWKLGNSTDTITNNSFNYAYGSAGFYSVKLVVTADAGCRDSVSQNITVYPVASISAMPTDVACNGIPTGQIAISTLGGTPPFLYSINAGANYASSSSFTGLNSGAYNITTIDANGCVADLPTNPLNISQAPPIVLSIDSLVDVFCFGGNDGFVSAGVSGGTPPYLFSIDTVNFQTSDNFGGLTASPIRVTMRDANNCIATFDTIVGQPATPISLTFNFNNILCNGDSSGQIVLNASGSVGNYEYSIDGGTTLVTSNTFGSLPAGSYTMFVKDSNNCQTSQGLTLTEPSSAVSLSLVNSSNVNCFGDNTGSIEVIAIGGTGALTYALNAGNFSPNTTFSNLTASSYTVYSRDFNGCLDSVSLQLTQPATALQIDTTVITDLLCFNSATGGIAVTASGGSPSYVYRLNNGINQASNSFTISAGGVYRVNVIDSLGCIAFDSVQVNSPSELMVNISNVTNESCELQGNGSIEVNAIGGTSPFTYSTDNSQFNANNVLGNLINGSYTIYVKDANNCLSTAQATVDADSLLPIAAFTQFLAGNTVSFSNQSTNDNKVWWNFGDGNTSITENPVHLYSNNAIYSVTLAAINGCGSDTLIRAVDVNSTSVIELDGANSLSVYPNPAAYQTTFNVVTQLVGNNAVVKVFNPIGKVVFVENLRDNSTNIIPFDTQNLSSGIYLVEVSGSAKTITKKLIINK